MRIELYFTIKNYRTHLCALALSCVRNVHVACAVRVADRDAEAGNASRSRGARQSLARPTLPLRRAATRQGARSQRGGGKTWLISHVKSNMASWIRGEEKT